jgi:hypothetical protein
MVGDILLNRYFLTDNFFYLLDHGDENLNSVKPINPLFIE